MSDDRYNQEEQYSSDVSEHSVSTPINNSQNEEKEQLPSNSPSMSNSSKVEQVYICYLK